MFKTTHHESRVIAMSTERMFDLVADVERYPEFLPLIRKARVIRRHADGYETEQVLMLGLVNHRFRTRTELQSPHAITVSSVDRHFRHFDIRWRFGPVPAGGCRVDFALDCEVASLWFKPLGDLLVAQMALTMVNAFAARARRLEADRSSSVSRPKA